jgi:hypothetical protein
MIMLIWLEISCIRNVLLKIFLKNKKYSLFFPLLSIELPQLPYDKFSTLGYLLSPLRDPTVIGMSVQLASSLVLFIPSHREMVTV